MFLANYNLSLWLGIDRLTAVRYSVKSGMNTPPAHYARHRFPAEIISHAVWLYFHFTLSFRDIEELLASRGIVVSNETIRQWCLKFGQTHANTLCRRQSKRGVKWHLDEVYLTINGKIHYLWRAVDQDGHVLDILVQSHRNRQAAKRFFRKLLKGLQYSPRVLVTNNLKSYAAAKRDILPGVEHRQHKGLNNRTELTSANPSERTPDAPLQVARPGAALSIRPWPHPQSLPLPASPPLPC